MASPSPPQNPNPSCDSKKKSSLGGPHVYQIGGVPVEFPYKPYGTQLAFMGRVIATLDRGRRQGRSHALLESPTGTGKSLSLLCSALAWQQSHQHRFPHANPNPNPTPPAPDADADADPLVHGGGFIPEPEPHGNLEQPPPGTSARAQRKLVTPTIYYATRTHAQITQVIREFRKTSYRVPMAVLASRKRYCTNDHVCSKENVDEECKKLLKDQKGESGGCIEFKNAHKVKCHPSLQTGGCNEVHDIEDLVKVGQSVKGCSYFAAQTMAAEAQLVFCPYSYIINPIVRRAMDISIGGCIVILDEAHNIEDISRDAASIDLGEEVLFMLQMELGQLCTGDLMIYQPLYDIIQGIITWIGDKKENLPKRDFEHYASFWTGEKAVRELQLAGITQQCLPILLECATKAIKAASDSEPDGDYLSGVAAIALEGLFSSLRYFFLENGSHTLDFQLALQRHVNRDGSNAGGGWKCTLSLWCLNPAIVFREIGNLSLSVILASGTLSPMGTFASELGVQFNACMEAPHVIDVESQLFAAVIPSGPANCPLNASYKTADSYGFQDALGASLEEICKIVPGGALVFFPSYKLLEKLRVRWCQTGQWSRLNAEKPIFVEPRNAEEFQPVLRGYYDAICGSSKTASGKTKRSLKRVVKQPSTKGSTQNPAKGGAAFLAVCRGKVSEGIDFSDENARVVVIVGIPFPNINDIQVVLKKKYNDTYRTSKSLLSGSDWYCHQAFRALNQAAGRCIRHKSDYGAIILLDERFKEQRNLIYVSKWIRNSIKQYDDFDDSLEGLRIFFQNVEKRMSPEAKDATGKDALQTESLVSDTKEEILPYLKPNYLVEGIPHKNQKVRKLKNQNRRQVVPDSKVANKRITQAAKVAIIEVTDEAPLSPIKASYNLKAEEAAETNEKHLSSSRDYIDLEGPTHLQPECSKTISVPSSINNLPQYVVIEDTGIRDQITNSTDIFKAAKPYSTCYASGQLQDRPPSLSTTVSSRDLSEGACVTAVTPERIPFVDLYNSEQESTLNRSVNSHSEKRRKLIGSQLLSCTQMDHLRSPDAESSCQVDCSNCCVSRGIDQRSETLSPDTYLRYQDQKATQGMFIQNKFGTSNLSSDLRMEKLHIHCLICKSPLGLPDNDYLVSCSLTSSSKVYLAYVLKNGPPSTSLSDHFSRTPQINVCVVICDVSSVDPRIFNSSTRNGASNQGVWSEEDGCVFRTVSCPICTVPKTLGLQVIATNALNVHLMNKVLLYADYLDIKNEQTSDEEATMPICPKVNGQSSGLGEIEQSAYDLSPTNKFGTSNKTKSKLKLPKKDQFLAESR